MARLTWDGTGQKIYESGTDRGVIYPYNKTTNSYTGGVAWNGLTAVNEKPTGAESNELWADNIKYGDLRSAEKYEGTIEAYTYPDEFAVMDGSAALATGVTIGQQNRPTFGLSYRTGIGNDTDGRDHGYKLHLVYGVTVSPSEKAYKTDDDNPEAVTFSWDFTTTPVPVTGFKPTSHLVIDSTKVEATALASLEDVLYGSGSGDNPTLPLPDAVKAMF